MYRVVTETDLVTGEIATEWNSFEYAITEFRRQTYTIIASSTVGSVTLWRDDPSDTFDERNREVAFFRFDPDAA